jgi:hypothetical protein
MHVAAAAFCETSSGRAPLRASDPELASSIKASNLMML